ncbi:MAG: Thioredoxin [Nitrosopumilales archaeon]|nr:MAG: Thioredoxin [Nitrosopumilales archaeon]MCH8975055.1 thioredoxin [Nitrososphaerota archaeon]
MVDEEIERIKEKKLAEMLKKQQEQQIQHETGVIELNSGNFEKTISSQTPTLVDFWAEWCGPCRTMHPVFTRLSKKFKKIRFARLNIDQNQDIATKLGIQAIPIFIMFKTGMPVDKVVGAVGEPGINLLAQKYSQE